MSGAATSTAPVEQAAFREAIDRDRAGLLEAWSERIAALAVRLDSHKPLVIGLVGLSLAQADDDHEALLVVAPLKLVDGTGSPCRALALVPRGGG